MNKLLVVIFLLAPALILAEKPTPNPADFTVTVHVQSSHLVSVCSAGNSIWVQELNVVIDGKKYEIEDGSSRLDLLRTGEYKARILKDETTRTYEYRRTYEFLFTDGKTRQYVVVGESE